MGCITLPFAQNSVLSSGQWFKVAIEKHGAYRISYDMLKNAGMAVDNIDPRNLKIFGNSGGMLPQSSAIERPTGLVQNTIRVVGEEDGSFDPGDYILFYGFGPHEHGYNEDGSLNFEYNIYANENYYFISGDGPAGLRIQERQNMAGGLPVITTFNDFIHHEIEETNLLISGREWYGEKFDLTTSREFPFSFEGVSAGSEVKVTSDVMAQSFGESTFEIAVNGVSVGTQRVAAVPDFLNPISNNPFRYSIKGRTSRDVFSINEDQLSGVDNLNVSLSYNKSSSGRSVGYLNYLNVEVERRLQRYGAQTSFRSLESKTSVSPGYEVGNVSTGNVIWDISDRETVINQQYIQSGTSASFGVVADGLQEFVVFDPLQIAEPTQIMPQPNQDLLGISTPELLIVTHPVFLSEAQRLADFRSNHDNMVVAVVTTGQVYNEFSSGKQDVSAIRDFTKYLYEKSDGLKYLLLFGKGSYDYKDILEENKNFVPIYESYNSLHPLDTYASDDYYGFLEDDEGAWNEVRGGNHSLEIGLGRLPVSTLAEAKVVVDKIIRYSSDMSSLGSWRNEVIFVADDGDINLHQRQADQLSVFVDTTYTAFNTKKLFLDAFPQISKPSGQTSPDARRALSNLVEDGALIVNFTGHGGESGWMQEQVLDLFLIEEWSNRNKLPLFMTATCEFGRHDDPKRVSGGELVVTKERGGGIAIVSTCRPVSSSSNFQLNKAFYNTIFSIEDGQFLRLGDIFRLTKNASVDLASDFKKVGNRNFALLGDPSMRLAYPENNIVITKITESGNESDTLKALAKVEVTGEVHGGAGLKIETFNGVVDVTVFDREIARTTLGADNPPYTHKEKINKVFKGSATVQDGEFKVQFIVPKNISQQFAPGKISLYASDSFAFSDGNGADKSVLFGGTVAQTSVDNRGPDISLFVGDTLKSRTTDISHNTFLYAFLSDENGINISGFGVANSLTATLDDDQVFILNDFYNAKKDTYQEGVAVFPLNGLEKGRHVIRLKAWDTFNNSSEKEIEFFVADPNSLLVSELKNTPNPVRSATTFSFDHNRSGDDLEVNLQIISSMGELVRDLDFRVDDSLPRVDLFEWDGSSTTGEKLTQGIYLYRVTVRSVLDGAKGQNYQKLIIIN